MHVYMAMAEALVEATKELQNMEVIAFRRWASWARHKSQEELEEMRRFFKQWYDVKDRGIMGSGIKDIKEIVILGRTLKFTEAGLEYAADGKHRDAILEALGLEPESKSLGCPALAADKMDESGDEEELRRRVKSSPISVLSVMGESFHVPRTESRAPIAITIATTIT